jgi:hypothetical protein
VDRQPHAKNNFLDIEAIKNYEALQSCIVVDREVPEYSLYSLVATGAMTSRRHKNKIAARHRKGMGNWECKLIFLGILQSAGFFSLP